MIGPNGEVYVWDIRGEMHIFRAAPEFLGFKALPMNTIIQGGDVICAPLSDCLTYNHPIDHPYFGTIGRKALDATISHEYCVYRPIANIGKAVILSGNPHFSKPLPLP